MIAWMSGALVSFVIAAVAIRNLGAALSVFEINMVRTGGGLAILLAMVVANPVLARDIVWSEALAHLPRNVVHAAGGLLWTLSITLLPLATVFALEFTAPAWAALLAYGILGERIGPRRAIGIGACLVGVLVVLRPSPATFQLTALLPLGAAFCFALSLLLMRKLVLSRSVFAILFWTMALQFPINLAGALTLGGTDGGGFAWTPAFVAVMASLAVAGLFSQYCLSKALSHGQAVSVVPLDFLRVPLIAVVGWLLYAEPIDLWVLAGVAIIVSGIVYGLFPPRLRARRPTPDGGRPG
jgi:drug/metabolite transporter (DMT)-like permease